MAFTTRGDRQTLSEKLGSTPATVGPGSYGSYFNQEIEHAYAPFSSTTDRDAGGAVRPSEFVTPGPGSYDVTGRKYFGGPRFLSAPSEAGFLSKSTRMTAESQERIGRPGPGAYTIASSFDGKTIPKAAIHPVGREDKHVVWFRAPTAPSIPCQDQAFGYEEGIAGQLVKQQAPIKRFKGDKSDMVGPGAYDASIAPTRPNIRGHDFGRSKGARTELSKSFNATFELPGPGTYDTSVVLEPEDIRPQRKKPTANFASRVLRPHQIPKQDLESKKPAPGPGQYTLPDAFTRANKPLPDSLQCFGSTSKRAFALSHRDRLPGPGTYEDPRSSFVDMTGIAGATRIQRRAAPFLSTGSRFNMQKMKAGLPGPGQYDETNRDNFVAQLAKKRFSRGGHFGSTSKRFIPPSDKPKPREGVPSTYENKAPKQIHGHLKKGPMSIFLSNTHRNAANKSQEKSGPSPGQYYKSVEWGTGYKRPDNAKGGVFISQAQRFNLGDDKAVPGPGAYSQDVATVGAEVQKVLKRRILSGEDQPSVHFGTEARFAGGRGLDWPGPGSYDGVDPYGQLLKRSFNITVEGSV